MCREPMRCFAMRKVEAHPLADSILAAARARIGVRFRPQGRGVEGLDCLGLVLGAGQAAGLNLVAPHFALRGMRLEQARARLATAGLQEVAEAAPGDVMLGAPATLQLHLAFWTGSGVIEAHAGLGRVVERRFVEGESWDSAWRLPMGECAWHR